MITMVLASAALLANVHGYTMFTDYDASNYPASARAALDTYQSTMSDGSLENIGNAVCSDMRHGYSMMQEVNSIKVGWAQNQTFASDPLTDYQAGWMVGSAIRVYCPQNMYEPPFGR